MQDFNEIINSDTPTLVDFHAEWCEPCKIMTPVLHNIAKQVNGKVRILKVDIDKNRPVSTKYNVLAVPTLLLFQKGEIKWRQTGVLMENEIIDVLSKFAPLS